VDLLAEDAQPTAVRGVGGGAGAGPVAVGSSAWSSGATAVTGAGVLAASAGEAASFGSATAGRPGQKHRMGIWSFSSGPVERREY
jgi:hypothetical protein